MVATKSRGRIIAGVVGVFLLIGATLLFVLRSSQQPGPSSRDSKERPDGSGPTLLETRARSDSSIREDTSPSKIVLTKDESREMKSRLAQAKSVFRTIESKYTKMLFEIEYEKGQQVSAMIQTPDNETYGAYTDALGAAMNGSSERIRRAANDEMLHLLNSYVNFPSPFRVVSRWLPKETPQAGNSPRRIGFEEIYVYNQNAVTTNADGSVTYTNVAGSQALGEEGLERYEYLFEQHFRARETEPDEK